MELRGGPTRWRELEGDPRPRAPIGPRLLGTRPFASVPPTGPHLGSGYALGGEGRKGSVR